MAFYNAKMKTIEAHQFFVSNWKELPNDVLEFIYKNAVQEGDFIVKKDNVFFRISAKEFLDVFEPVQTPI